MSNANQLTFNFPKISKKQVGDIVVATIYNTDHRKLKVISITDKYIECRSVNYTNLKPKNYDVITGFLKGDSIGKEKLVELTEFEVKVIFDKIYFTEKCAKKQNELASHLLTCDTLSLEKINAIREILELSKI